MWAQGDLHLVATDVSMAAAILSNPITSRVVVKSIR
jgi:hypothetical protein